MYIKIRTDIFQAAIRAGARAESVELQINPSYPSPFNQFVPWFVICELVPEIDELHTNYIAVGGNQPDPAEAFFSIDPPGLWMRLRELIGPNSSHDGPLKDFLESNEALVITLHKFLELVEMTQDFAYEDRFEALKLEWEEARSDTEL